MLRPIPATECDRARAAASAWVDGELSELDSAYLAAHRQLCAECDAFAGGIEATAAALRSAPLVQPSRPLVFSRLRRPARQLTVRAAAGVAAAAAVLAFVAGHVIQPAGTAGAHRAASRAPLRLVPPRAPAPFSAYYSLTSPTGPLPRGGDNVAV